MPVLQTVAETPQFIRDANAAGLSEDERKVIVDGVAANRFKEMKSVVPAECARFASLDAAKARAEVIGW